MSRFGYHLTILLLFALLATTAYFVLERRLESGADMPAYSAYSREPDGLGAAADVLRQLGFRPVALTRPVQNTRHEGLLVMVEPQRNNPLLGPEPGLGENDAHGLLDWVKRGNTLVLAASEATPVHEELRVQVVSEPPGDDRTVYEAEAAEVGGYTEPSGGDGLLRVRTLGVARRSSVRGRDGLPLWYVNDRPGAWLAPYGDGRVLFLADPSLWTHRGLLRRDNVLFLYNVARMDATDGRVYFDEYHHGLRSGGGYWDYLRYHDLHWAAVQLLLVVGVAVWAVAIRLGPAVPTPPPARADAVDYAAAAARIYQRAGLTHRLAAHAARDFLDGLTRQLRLRRTAPAREIAATWRQRHGEDSARELAPLLRRAEEMQADASTGPRLSRRELLQRLRAFDEFLRKQRKG